MPERLNNKQSALERPPSFGKVEDRFLGTGALPHHVYIVPGGGAGVTNNRFFKPIGSEIIDSYKKGDPIYQDGRRGAFEHAHGTGHNWRVTVFHKGEEYEVDIPGRWVEKE